MEADYFSLCTDYVNLHLRPMIAVSVIEIRAYLLLKAGLNSGETQNGRKFCNR